MVWPPYVFSFSMILRNAMTTQNSRLLITVQYSQGYSSTVVYFRTFQLVHLYVLNTLKIHRSTIVIIITCERVIALKLATRPNIVLYRDNLPIPNNLIFTINQCSVHAVLLNFSIQCCKIVSHFLICERLRKCYHFAEFRVIIDSIRFDSIRSIYRSLQYISCHVTPRSPF